MRVKYFFAIALVFMLSCAVSAYASSVRIGALTRYTEDPAKDWNIIKGIHAKNDGVVFYDSLQEIILALFRGDIDEADLPGIVGLYVLNSNSSLRTKCIVRVKAQHLVFGFMKDRGEELRGKFNSALFELKADKTLDKLKKLYLRNNPVAESKIEFMRFNDAQTIRVAITGDLPPIDYVNADGRAAGFNAALLAEIAKRLKINIKLIHVNTSARSSALASGRADVVFWYQLSEYEGKNLDIPEGVIVSEPYYDWNNFVHISLKQ